MKTKRRMTAIALAACMLGSAAPLGASAAEYNVLYDVNRDGTVSITDTISLSQYLIGAYSVSDQSVFDVNQNSLVDALDVQDLTAYLVSRTVSWQYYNVLAD